jgi:uncharacterized protein (DUF1501 family)
MAVLDQLKKSAIDSIFSKHYENLHELTYKDIVRQSQDAHLVYKNAIANITPLQTSFTSTNPLALDLKVVAETIAARMDLGMSRQVFFITYGGWDHHDEVLNNQSVMLANVDEALGQFYNAIESDLQISDKVTSFTVSDFGRTLSSNGNGSDHAWGGNHLILGGAVNGGIIYGDYPDLYINSPLDIGRGRFIPSTASDEYFAELALWFGVPKTELDMVLPNIEKFYILSNPNAPLGFMS